MRIIQTIQNYTAQLNITSLLKTINNGICISVICFIFSKLAAKSFHLIAKLFQQKKIDAEKKELIDKCIPQKEELLYLEKSLNEAKITKEKLKKENLILKDNISEADLLRFKLFEQTERMTSSINKNSK